jgi:hypothetical protein
LTCLPLATQQLTHEGHAYAEPSGHLNLPRTWLSAGLRDTLP